MSAAAPPKALREDLLAPYALKPSRSRGRVHQEPESANRTCFQRDRDRIIHCTGFRRMKHKTQVFVYHEGDHFRTRLTHSLEVSQLARAIARSLSLDEDLAEALALAHDLGHPPFGHAGEEALNDAMGDYGGFDHNAQTLRLLTRLERRYAAFEGLNLTWETLEGLAKHNGPQAHRPVDPKQPPADLPFALREVLAEVDLELHRHAPAEAQVAALADDVAYDSHDMDDGLRAGLFTLEDIAAVPLVADMLARIDRLYGRLPETIRIHELVRRIIGAMVEDIVAESQARLDQLAPRDADAIRDAGHPVIGFSRGVAEQEQTLRDFLFARMYRHHLVNRASAKGKRVVSDLFALYIERPDCLPPEWAARATAPHAPKTARAVADYIAGMTDRFAIREHAKLFDLSTMPL
ncbi:MAG: deoxyguanosinetriphosphate triphosphohydrolase [Rhodothalassiaceae bacterium]